MKFIASLTDEGLVKRIAECRDNTRTSANRARTGEIGWMIAQADNSSYIEALEEQVTRLQRQVATLRLTELPIGWVAAPKEYYLSVPASLSNS